VGAEGVFIAEIDGRPVGCLALCSNGEILDPCCDPGVDQTEAMTSLLAAAEKASRQRGIHRITLNVPYDHKPFNEACKALGMRPVRPQRKFSLSMLDYKSTLARVLASTRIPEGSFELQIRMGRAAEKLVIRSEGGRTEISDSGQADVTIRVDETAFNCIVFSHGLSLRDLLLGRVSISPLWAIPKGLRLLKSLSLRPRWFIPRGGSI